VELAAISPGSGQLRVACVESVYMMSCLRRVRDFLEHIAESSSEEGGEERRVHVPPDLLRTDLLLHVASNYWEYGIEFALLVCLLQLVLNRRGRPSDVFQGVMDGTQGTFHYGIKEVPPLTRDDVIAMRRGGIRRLFIGQPATIVADSDASPYEMPKDQRYRPMSEAAVEDLGPDVPPLQITIIPDYSSLTRYLTPGAADSILMETPLRAEAAESLEEGLEEEK